MLQKAHSRAYSVRQTGIVGSSDSSEHANEHHERVRVTEGATNTNGNAVYGSAHQDSNTMFVDIDDDRIGSLVNTVAHEGMHLNGAGETNATVTGYMIDLAYRANAYANREAIDSHRPAPVAIQNEVSHQQLLGGNQAVFDAVDERGELEYRQLHRTEQNWIMDNAEAFAEQQGITVNEAIERLGQGALANVDYLWRAQLGGEEDTEAQEFLSRINAGDHYWLSSRCPS